MARSAWRMGMEATGCGCATVARAERVEGDPWSGGAAHGSLEARAIEELEWFGAALNRPRRLSRELIALARVILPRLVDERVVLCEGRAWSGHAPQRVLAAAAFAMADAPQWPWFLRTHAVGAHFETIPSDAWQRSADRFAAWAFGVSLPRVRALRSFLRPETRGVTRPAFDATLGLDGDRWIAPSIREARGNAALRDLQALAIERARRAEAER